MSPCVSFLPFLAPFNKLLGLLGGDEEIRTLDPLLAGQVLSQLSYTPGSSLDPENRTTKFVLKLALSSFLSFFDAFVRWHLFCFYQ